MTPSLPFTENLSRTSHNNNSNIDNTFTYYHRNHLEKKDSDLIPALSTSISSLASDLDLPPITPAHSQSLQEDENCDSSMLFTPASGSTTSTKGNLRVDSELGSRASSPRHVSQLGQQFCNISINPKNSDNKLCLNEQARRAFSLGGVAAAFDNLNNSKYTSILNQDESPNTSPTAIRTSPTTIRNNGGNKEGAGSITAAFAAARSRPIATHPTEYSNSSNSTGFSRSCSSTNISAFQHFRGASAPGVVTASSYDSLPWSPAVEFLSGFANVTAPASRPDDEGEQVGEYILGKMIGHGGFSVVREAVTMDTDGNTQKVAVKIVPRSKDEDDSERAYSLLDRELAIWKHLDHPHILPMLSVVENDYGMFIFTMLCPGGNLLDYIRKRGEDSGRETPTLDIHETRRIFRQIASAVRYLHEDAKVIHKDLKLENCLLDADGSWRVADFGLTESQQQQISSVTIKSDLQRHHSVSSTSKSTSKCRDVHAQVGGSLEYMSPESFGSSTPVNSPASDMWALGVILYVLLCGKLPFSDDYPPRLQLKIMRGRYDPPICFECLKEESEFDIDPETKQIISDAKSTLEGLLNISPSKRWTIRELVESSFCAESESTFPYGT